MVVCVKVTHVIIDEVDTMLIQGFGPDIKDLLGPILFSPERKTEVQFVLATATMTKAVRKLLEGGDLPPVRVLETDDLHHAVPTASHRMLDTKGGDKLTMLVDLVGGARGKDQRTLVFCNTVQSCRAADHTLREAGLVTRGYHGDMPSNDRAKSLAEFKAGDAPLLVCTDLASRGLDMPRVSRVVMFDFPSNPIDYLHRAGRTARFGARGEVVSLITKRDRVLATAIERAVARGEPLDTLTNSKRDYQPGGRLSSSTRPQSGGQGGRRSSDSSRGERGARGRGSGSGRGRGSSGSGGRGSSGGRGRGRR